MQLYDELGVPRIGQVTRCEVRDLVAASAREAARAFGLFETVDVEVDAASARSILVSLLCEFADWDGPLVKRQALAEQAAARLLARIDTASARYFTNGHGSGGRITGWNAATPSAYDSGILVISDTQVTCVWVQNDD